MKSMTEEYQIEREITPKELLCVIGGCPAMYESIRTVTPTNFDCGIGPCPGIYEAATSAENVYLIVGKQVDPKAAGLEQKVGAGEVLIEVPRALIDYRGK